MKPIIKWVGGKARLLKVIKKFEPDKYTAYYEPFCGGAINAIDKKNVHLSDYNNRLINAYSFVKSDVEGVIGWLQQKDSSKEEYLTERTLLNDDATLEQAARFIYLNKTGFNGLYRVNKSNIFNVPYGSNNGVNSIDYDNMREYSKWLQNVSLESKSYDKVSIVKGAYYFIDPPYDDTFVGYSDAGFNKTDQSNLLDYVNKINDAGGKFIVTNHATDFIKDLYKDYNQYLFNVTQSVGAKGRGQRKEILIHN